MFEYNTTCESADNQLLQSIRLDDKAAFDQVYKRYWSKLYVYAFNVLREKEICEDVVQEIFIDLWARRHDVQISELSSYLFHSVKHQIFNHFRKSKYKKQLIMNFGLINEEYKIDESYEKKEMADHIKDAISRLPGRRRMVFDLSRNEGLSNKEISEKLGISLQTVKNQISESLRFIRKSVNNSYLLFF